MLRILKGLDDIEILAPGDIAEGGGLADEPAVLRIERQEPVQKLMAEAVLE